MLSLIGRAGGRTSGIVSSNHLSRFCTTRCSLCRIRKYGHACLCVHGIIEASFANSLIYTSQGKTMILPRANNVCNWFALLFRISMPLFTDGLETVESLL